MKRFGRDASGATTLEFAMVAPAAIALMFGVIEAGRLMFLLNGMEAGLSAAARVQMLDSAATDAQIRAAFCARVSGGACERTAFAIEQRTLNGQVWREVRVTTQFESPLATLLPLPTELTESRSTPVL